MILLILPFFLPLTNSLCSFASSILTLMVYCACVTNLIWEITCSAALTASSEPSIVKERRWKEISASELAQMSPSMSLMSLSSGSLRPSGWAAQNPL